LYQNLDNILDKKTYKEPEVFTSNLSKTATWRIVWYEMVAPGKWKRARPTGNINRIKDIAERLIAAKLLCKMISEALGKGWRYYQPKSQGSAYGKINVIDCITEHAASKALGLSTKKSGDSYKSWCNIFCSFLKTEKLYHLTINELSAIHIQLFVDRQLALKKSNRTINNIIEGVSSVFNRIVKLHKLPSNPFKEVDKLRETESTRFETFTDTELTKIGNHLKKVHPQMWLFFLHVYYGYLRPATIVLMQAGNYNFAENKINVNPDKHKNRRANYKQILFPLREALLAAGVDKMNPDTYLFSARMQPGPEKRVATMATKVWRKYIIDGLGIDKKLYAGKHTGATDFLLQNSGQENISWFQNQMGHSTLAESQAYIDKKKRIELDETKVNIKKL
jgi:integrase